MLAIAAAVLLALAPQHDTLFMSDGGRVVGTVVEEGPQGVSIQLLDGTIRRYAARDVLRIEYADGTVSTPRAPAPAQPPAQQPPAQPPSPPRPPQQYAPPQYLPPPPHGQYAPPRYPPYGPQPQPAGAAPPRSMAPISPLYAVLGLGGVAMSGGVEHGISMGRTFEPQLGIWLETGIRLVPELSLGGYLGIGVGDPAEEVRAECSLLGTTCTATTGRIGILLRRTFDPTGRSAPWIAVGTGFEFGSVALDHMRMGGSSDLFTYTGWEALRLMAGVDLRTSPIVGVGLYGAVAWGRYTRYEDAFVTVDLGGQPFHTTVEAGLRFTLFP